MLRLCQVCKNPILNSHRVFCSRKCALTRAHYAETMRSCAWCGQEFPLTRTGKEREKQICCSRNCGAKYTGEAKRGRILETFWQHVAHCEHEWLCPYCCWPWTGSLAAKYGSVQVNYEQMGTHRLAWQLGNNRPFPPELFAAHYCHTPACCNFIHIHPATQKENYADSLRDGRVLRGEQKSNSKLTEETVQEAFHLRSTGMSIKNIAAHLVVSKSAIQVLLKRRAWKHVKIE